MSRSSTRRGQTEPLAALAAVLALVAGLVLYSGAYAGALPGTGDRDLAEPTLRRVAERVGAGPVVVPARLETAMDAGPAGHHLNVTLRAGNRTWSAGPVAPPGAERAARPVSVRTGNATREPGRLAVEVWS